MNRLINHHRTNRNSVILILSWIIVSIIYFYWNISHEYEKAINNVTVMTAVQLYKDHIIYLWISGIVLMLIFIFRIGKNENELRKFFYAVEQGSTSVMITDKEGKIEYVNPKFTDVTGYTPDEVIGKKPNILKSGETPSEVYHDLWTTLLSGKEWHGEFKNRNKSGEVFWCLESISAVKNESGKITHFIAMAENISQLKNAEETILKLAYFDPLTDLPNRRSFLDQLEKFAHWTNRIDCQMALFYIDLDRFKATNEILGHAVGDKLLKIIGERLTVSLRGGDSVFRLGGDEFAVIATNIINNRGAIAVAEGIIRCIQEPVLIGDHEIIITTSVGISMYPADTSNLEELLKNADIALYHAKEKGKNLYQFYSDKINTMTLDHLQIENDLRKAIERKELFLVFQPQINLLTDKVDEVEALIRWNHPVHGMIPPGRFIPIAEETGQILQIGAWVIDEVVRQIAKWDEEGFHRLTVAINLSAVQFNSRKLIQNITHMLISSNIAPDRLEFEITESALMGNPERAGKILEALKDIGFKVSIDDFGTGYSSLNYLKRFQVNELKIDKSFIDEITTNKYDLAIAITIISLAKGLSLKVIAEGVETEEQMKILKEIKCDLIQGYYYSKPLLAEDLKKYVNSLNGHI